MQNFQQQQHRYEGELQKKNEKKKKRITFIFWSGVFQTK